MVPNSSLLQVAAQRIEFWQDQLQAAFRCGNAERAAECVRVLDEYRLLTEESLQVGLRPPDITSP